MQASDRDDLIEAVKHGRMTPAEAEAAAAQLGLEPFARRPDPRKYNPMDVPWWSISMSVAWIVWRNPQKVLDYYDPYRTECLSWLARRWRVGETGAIIQGHFLETEKRATLSLMSIEEKFDEVEPLRPKRMEINAARAELWRALQEDAIKATGVPEMGGARRQIQDYEWHDLKTVEDDGKGLTEPFNGYREIILQKKGIISRWPADESVSSTIRSGAPGRPTSMHLVVVEYRARLRNGKTEKRVTAESKILAQWLQEMHPTLPRLTPKTIRNKISEEHRCRFRNGLKL